MPHHRVLDVVVAERRDSAAGAGSGSHAFCLGKAHRHRLFAPDVLAGLERGDGHLGVEGIGRGHRDHRHLWIGDHVAPVAGGFFEAEFGGAACREVGGRLPQMHQPRRRPVAEHRLDGVPGQGVALAHIAGADEPDADRLHP